MWINVFCVVSIKFYFSLSVSVHNQYVKMIFPIRDQRIIIGTNGYVPFSFFLNYFMLSKILIIC